MGFRRGIAYVIPYFWDFCEPQKRNRTDNCKKKATCRYVALTEGCQLRTLIKAQLCLANDEQWDIARRCNTSSR